MKIIVIGAGQGGMQAAKVLAANGVDVTVYEKESVVNHCHDQIDVVSPALFTDLNIPLPEGTVKNRPATFVAPYSNDSFLLDLPMEKRTWNIERKAFAKIQREECEKAGVKFLFETPVDKLIFEKDDVVGIVCNGEEIRADLVIDSSGVHSPFRASFNGKHGITSHPKEDEVFQTYHAYYEPKEGVELPEPYNYYLKFCDLPGICWCGIETDGTVSTLVGKIGKMTEKEFKRASDQLRFENKIISDNMLRGGKLIDIPVRYPAPIMVAPGYASIGDCAFMTVPIMGNGIENAVRAGQILADKILENDSTDINVLWKYNVEYFRKIGGICAFFDFLKRGLLVADSNDITFIMGSGIVTNDDIAAVIAGRKPDITPAGLVARLRKLIGVRKSVGVMLTHVIRGADAMVIASQLIPEEYGVQIYQWKYRLEHLFSK